MVLTYTTINMKLQKMGIEIRKIGDVKALYDDVDLVLMESGMSGEGISLDVQIQTVSHALQKMFKVESRFSVCTIRDCANVCQVSIPNERMNVYSSIHCMSWNEMLPKYRQLIVAMVLDDFREVLNLTESNLTN